MLVCVSGAQQIHRDMPDPPRAQSFGYRCIRGTESEVPLSKSSSCVVSGAGGGGESPGRGAVYTSKTGE